MFQHHESFGFLRDRSASCARPPWDVVLFQTENFVAVPSLGALVEGWVLIVPKRHALCVGALDSYLLDELCGFKEFVATAVEDCYGPVAAFEHGPAVLREKVGCGVDHAHLHILPARCDLADMASQCFSGQIDWREITGLDALYRFYNAGLPYIYVEQPLGRARAATHACFPSQLVRRGIASHLGVPDRYDWRAFPMLDNVTNTVKTLKSSRPENRVLVAVAN